MCIIFSNISLRIKPMLLEYSSYLFLSGWKPMNGWIFLWMSLHFILLVGGRTAAVAVFGLTTYKTFYLDR